MGKIEENHDTKIVKIRVPLKYLSNFQKTLEMSLIDCEINIILTSSNRCFIIDNPIANQEPTFTNNWHVLSVKTQKFMFQL